MKVRPGQHLDSSPPSVGSSCPGLLGCTGAGTYMVSGLSWCPSVLGLASSAIGCSALPQPGPVLMGGSVRRRSQS